MPSISPTTEAAPRRLSSPRLTQWAADQSTSNLRVTVNFWPAGLVVHADVAGALVGEPVPVVACVIGDNGFTVSPVPLSASHLTRCASEGDMITAITKELRRAVADIRKAAKLQREARPSPLPRRLAA